MDEYPGVENISDYLPTGLLRKQLLHDTAPNVG